VSAAIAKEKPRIDAGIIEAMRQRLPDYLEASGHELRRQGTRLVTHCPMHHDEIPSFAVFAEGQACGCFPCGWKGDIYSFVQWTGKAATFPDAVRHVAAVLGVVMPGDTTGTATAATRPAMAAPARKPAPAFALADAEREKIRAARLRFSCAFHDAEPIIDEIAESLAVPREALRWAAHGSDGLALAPGRHGGPEWLCYAYSTGLKWRNPNPLAKPRFDWLIGKATAPWRMAWAKNPDVRTVYLTEGESDALALIAAGAERDGKTACVASPGTSFQSGWASMFEGKRVVICFDADEAGQDATVKVAKILHGHAAGILTWKGAARHV
jgi:hypothetical protein